MRVRQAAGENPETSLAHPYPLVSILRCIVFTGASQLWEESVEGPTDSGEWMSGYSTASSLKDLAEITIGYLARCYLIGVYTEKYLV